MNRPKEADDPGINQTPRKPRNQVEQLQEELEYANQKMEGQKEELLNLYRQIHGYNYGATIGSLSGQIGKDTY